MADTSVAVEIRPLTKELIEENLPALVDMSRQLAGDYWTLEHYLTDYNRKWELSSATYINNELCGFIIVSEKEASLHVHRIVVSPKYQSAGIGRMLIERTAGDVQRLNKGKITLKAEANNERSVNFYKKLNFETTGTQGDLLLLELKIAP